MATSIEPSGSGNSSMKPWRNSALVRPAAAALRAALASIAGVMSTPSTRPVDPTMRAAIRLSKPAPQPMSSARSPGASGPNSNGLPVPANDSTAPAGSAAIHSSG